MFDRNSDYALNKRDPDAIVCKSVTGIHIRLTCADFSNETEFEIWKHWSDEDYHTIEKLNQQYGHRVLSLEELAEVAIAVGSVEMELIEQLSYQERLKLLRLVLKVMETSLTTTQRRRLERYMKGETEKEIAQAENVRQQSVSECLQAALKKLRKSFEMQSQE